jgi:hypothetical protein
LARFGLIEMQQKQGFERLPQRTKKRI